MLRRYAPKSLYWRVLLIVILPIFVMQGIITYIFFDRHWDLVSANLSTNVAGQIALITRLYQEAETEEARDELRDWATDDLDIDFRFDEGKTIPPKDLLAPFNVYNVVLNRRLRLRIEQPYQFDTQSWRDYIEVRVQLDDGVLIFLALRERAFATTGPIFLFWFFGTSILLGWIGTIFMRNQVKSILRLATAAEAFGRGRDAPDFRPAGAAEVRKAGYAFIAMRERIKRHLEQRASMLAGVSHDLRTPLTRIKLGLAMEKDTPEIDALRGDVAEMERMVEAYLDFARNEAADEHPEEVELSTLLEETVSDARRAGGKVYLDAFDAPIITARRLALKRAIGNLISNALRHGDTAWVSARSSQRRIQIFVEDNGPGIDPDDYEEVFKPFHRLDEARAISDDNGVGMGLTIVRDMARAHGGDVILSRSGHGGLCARIDLPV